MVPAAVASFAALALVAAAVVRSRGRARTSAELAEAVIHQVGVVHQVEPTRGLTALGFPLGFTSLKSNMR